MITTVTGNSPQEINTSLFSIESNINEQTKLLNSKIKEVNDAIAKINKILKGINKDAGVVSVNGKQGIVELTASDVGALPDTTVIPSPQVPSDWNATEGVSRILNKPNLAEVATSGRYSDLRNKPKLASVATSGNYNDLIDKPNLSTVATTGDYDDLSNKPNLATVATSGNYNDLNNKPNLATVATSGNYNDLNNKPTIPTNTSQLTNDSDFVTSSALNSVTAVGLKETYHFTRTNIAPQTWTDIIKPSDIPQSGIYIFNLYINDGTYWWTENVTFLTYFYATGTNSGDSTPIYFNQEGHAPNGKTIQLRFQRVSYNTLQQSIQIYFSDCNQSTISLEVSAYRVA